MKTIIRNLWAAILLVAGPLETHAQGLVYDQQTTNPPSLTGDYFNLQADTPLMQSFVPALSAIGFAQFQFWDMANNGTNGATVYVNVWTGSPKTSLATLLGSTTPVYMPNGFGASTVGITTFYFSTLIALTAGETYYLEPVVLSGDNPWAIKVAGDAYSNGQLYGNTGGYFQPTTDLYFTEGVVAVPEPSTLALVGLSGFLVFAFKRRCKLVVMLLFYISAFSVHATGDSVVQTTLGEAGLTPVEATALPDNATFWVIAVNSDGDLIESPYPALPPDLLTLPIYSVTNDIYIVDDTGAQLASASAGRLSNAQATSIARTQALTMASLIDEIQLDGSDGTNQPLELDYALRVYGSNDLWLSIYSVTNGISHIIIHPPWNVNVSTSSWNLFYTTNIATPFTNWWWILTTDFGQTNLIVPNATDAHGFYALGNANTNANSPTGDGDFPNICPNTQTNSVTLSAQDPNNLPLTYTVLTHPTNGVLTGTAPNLFYTPNPCFENGYDSFTYMASNGTNNSAPATVVITVEPDYLYADPVSALVFRGLPTPVALIGADSCGAVLNYALLTAPAYGTVTNASGQSTNANYIYTPNSTNFTGSDSFNYAVYDGCGDVATNTATVTAVPGPILIQECYTAGTAVELSASMDDATQELLYDNTYFSPYNFILYRSTYSGGPYTAIATNLNIYPLDPAIFYDTSAVVGQTNYYVVTFQAINNTTGVTNESPFSNEIAAPGRNPGLLLTATNVWNAVTNSANPTNVVRLQAPFSSQFPNQYATLLPLPNTYWPVGTTWSNSTTFFVPSNSVPLSQVVYAIAIDNDYQLYLNGSNAPIETFSHTGYADWSSSKSFESVAPGLVHYGTNNLRIVITDDGGINYFSMVVTTNSCGQ